MSVCLDQSTDGSEDGSEDGSDVCCINWGNRIYYKGTYRDLVNAGKAIVKDCQWGLYEQKYVSGNAKDVLIGDSCTTQCLSKLAGQCAV